jgi:hypothetical protein
MFGATAPYPTTSVAGASSPHCVLLNHTKRSIANGGVAPPARPGRSRSGKESDIPFTREEVLKVGHDLLHLLEKIEKDTSGLFSEKRQNEMAAIGIDLIRVGDASYTWGDRECSDCHEVKKTVRSIYRKKGDLHADHVCASCAKNYPPLI